MWYNVQMLYADILRDCYKLATESPDPSTQNGAILIDSGYAQGFYMGSGCNKFPDRVVQSADRWERPKKYSFIEHAERNALFDAAKKGLMLNRTPELTLVCPWAACADCARAMIQMGVRRLVTHKSMHDLPALRWSESIQYAFEMFKEAELEVVMFEGNLDSTPIRVNGEVLTF
jgi:dCMP deaminase